LQAYFNNPLTKEERLKRRVVPSTPKLPTLGIIDEDDYFDEITDVMSDDEEESDHERDDD